MNILMAVHHRLERNAGAAGATLALVDEFRAAGHRVDLFSVDDVRLPVGDRYRQAAFPGAVAFWVARQTHNTRYDVLDASTGDAWLWQQLAGRRRERPVLVTRSHGLEHISAQERKEEARRGGLALSRRWHIYDGKIRLWEVGMSLRTASCALFLNNTDRTFAIKHLGVSPQRARVIPNGLDRALVNLPSPQPGRDVRDIRIAQIGSHLPMKGIVYAAEALSRVLVRHPEVRVTLLGTGVDDKLALSGFDMALHPRVTIVSRFDRTDLPDLLEGHEILLFPTLSEGFGIALLEGMACGLAPVATRTAGPSEIVTDGQSGLLVPVRDAPALAAALERLIDDRVLRQRLRTAARARAQSFAWPSVAHRVLGVYAEALDGRPVMKNGSQ